VTDRPRQTDCQIEPAYPDHDTVLWSFRFPEFVAHRPSKRCCKECPHLMAECKEFDVNKEGGVK
jgi:hypothetical protein